MWRKLGGYSFIAGLSFCFFTVIFHTMAGAQTAPLPTPVKNPVTPSPTPRTNPRSRLTNISVPTALPSATTSPTRTIAVQSAQIAVTPTANPSPTVQPTTTPLPTETPTPTAIPQPTIAVVSDLESLFTKYSDEYHVSKDDLKKVAKCESGFNSEAVNGPYLGMYQFMEQTWISARTTMHMDTNPELRKNAEEAIRTAAFMFSNGQAHAWSGCL